MRMLFTAVAATAIVSLATPALASFPERFRMSELHASRQTGLVTIVPHGRNTIVKVFLKTSSTQPQPLHIHKGTCKTYTGTPAYPLAMVREGSSESVLPNLDPAVLVDRGYVLIAHQGPKNFNEVACAPLDDTNLVK